MNGTTIGDRQLADNTPARRPSGLARLVALMAAHRDNLATTNGQPRLLEQRQIDQIVDGLSAEPKRRAQAGQH